MKEEAVRGIGMGRGAGGSQEKRPIDFGLAPYQLWTLMLGYPDGQDSYSLSWRPSRARDLLTPNSPSSPPSLELE